MYLKSGQPLALTHYYPNLEPSCGTRMVEKINREMDLEG